ncbi:MAG: 2,3-diphosphoglycerate synthetase [Gaiellaceae bacterium]
MRAIAVIDGEHYAPVVRDALAALPYDFVGALLVGGTEKLRGGEDYGVPLVSSLDELEVGVVVDLSDEPVMPPAERFRLASRALALGLKYVGAEFHFEPPQLEPFDLPSLSVIGTGKRVGKTAVTAHVARLLARERDVVVVAMGRGGPAQPELVETAPTVDDLLALSRSGRHAASDHLEAAALAGVVTIGCRRAGGGLAGTVSHSNVAAGAELARSLEPDVVVFDGSGAAIPPVATSARILVTTAGHDLDAYLNPYRVAISDLVVGVGDVRGADVNVSLRLRPIQPLGGRRTAVFTTGAAPVEHLDAELVHVSRNLANREALRAELPGIDADVFVVELKAAAIDVVAEEAAARGAELVLAANDVSGDGLDDAILDLLPAKVPA